MLTRLLSRFFLFLGLHGHYVLVILVPAFLVVFAADSCNSPLQPGSTQEVLFELKAEWNQSKLAGELKARNLIKSAWLVEWLLIFKENLDLKAGEYPLSPAMSPKEMIAKFQEGKVKEHEITLPAGTTIKEIPAIISASGLVTEKEMQAGLRDREVMATVGIPAYIPEGYLIEGVYRFSKPIAAKEIVRRIVEQSKGRIDREVEKFNERSAELGFLPYDIIKLASLIEKETPRPEDRPLMSSMYHNRLRIGMPLQSEQALIYGIEDFKGEITIEQANAPGPYNTFLNNQPPATPICSPSIASIKNALYPADTDALYVLHGADGSLDFSTTFKQHQQKQKELSQNAQRSQQDTIANILHGE